MAEKVTIITPPSGRLVVGSVYTAYETDLDNKPLDTPRYFFGIAIPKSSPTENWQTTPWGKIVLDVGKQGFPSGQYNSANFSWKITDGDSQVLNSRGVAPCTLDGYAGCWIVKFNSGFKAVICNPDGTILEQEGAINLGDYVQVFATVVSNCSQKSPGVYLNATHVAFSGYGKRIVPTSSIDPKSIGFSQELYSGASATPVTTFSPPTPTPVAPPPVPAPVAPPPVPTPVAPPPYAQILVPPAPVAPPPPPASGPEMTDKAKALGVSYDQLIGAGWTDEQLIAQGYMVSQL